MTLNYILIDSKEWRANLCENNHSFIRVVLDVMPTKESVTHFGRSTRCWITFRRQVKESQTAAIFHVLKVIRLFLTSRKAAEVYTRGKYELYIPSISTWRETTSTMTKRLKTLRFSRFSNSCPLLFPTCTHTHTHEYQISNRRLLELFSSGSTSFFLLYFLSKCLILF